MLSPPQDSMNSSTTEITAAFLRGLEATPQAAAGSFAEQLAGAGGENDYWGGHLSVPVQAPPSPTETDPLEEQSSLDRLVTAVPGAATTPDVETPHMARGSFAEDVAAHVMSVRVEQASGGKNGVAGERSFGSTTQSAGLRAIAACVEQTHAEDLLEIGSLVRPHPAVREVAETALMLLGYREATWAAARSQFEQPDAFLGRMRSFDASKSVSRLQYHKLCRSLVGSPWNLEKGLPEARCPACRGLERWCRAVGELLASRYNDSTFPAPGSDGSQHRNAVAIAPAATAAATPTLLEEDPSTVENALPSRSWKVLIGDIEVSPDIYSLPSDELRHVRDLTIRRPGVGEVTFHGEIDLSQEKHVFKELPSIVCLELGEVVLYPDPGTKPPEGEGLNRPATVTLFQCLPPNPSKYADDEGKAKYRQRIARMTEAKGARFIDYDYDNGIWQFRVDHF